MKVGRVKDTRSHPENVLCLGAQLWPTLWNPMDCSPLGSSVHGDSPGKNTGVSCHALIWGIFPGIEPRSPTLLADSLPSKPPGKVKSTEVGRLSLLQGIFLIQELNQCLLHWRQILYCLSHKRSPRILKWVAYLFSRGPFWPRNGGLLHWRWIRYLLSYQGSPHAENSSA